MSDRPQSVVEVIEDRIRTGVETFGQGEPVQWLVAISSGPNAVPVANIWISIPSGVIGQSRGSWSAAPALDAGGSGGEDMVVDAVRQVLESLRSDRSAALANPGGLVAPGGLREPQGRPQGSNGLN